MKLILFIISALIAFVSAETVSTREYTKELFSLKISETSNKKYTVNGSTCTVDMIFFQGSATGQYFSGDITARDCTNVIKKYKDGRTEFKARYTLSGRDSNNNRGNVFIEDNLVGYDDKQRPVTKPTIITDINNLSWMQTADIKGIIEETNGNKVVHYMWNESNKSKLPYPVAQRPDETKNYNKEVFVFDIQVGGTGFGSVRGADSAVATSIGFTCSANTRQFKGRGLDNFVDTRFDFRGQPQTLSARYILEGTDEEGRKCRVYIENNGIDVNGINTQPIIITDNPKWAWIERAPLHGTSTMTQGFQIKLWTVNDPSLWENPIPEPTTVRTTTRNPYPTQPPSTNTRCSQKILAQGYPCCSSSNCQVTYTDNDGDWGFENGQWCGCGLKNVCPSSITNQGYPCCSSCSTVYYVDNDGRWGVENNNWCGIPSNC